ncbi:hypothetical protein LF1_29710 [Rubripirellula obstinata]|uniref:Uncharacterized protein n=1 Tax=Rubripirellula obstinata TaxID=406547 RepID=A0A5B1CJG8_9BACT|nr:hypothetical protein LF1_29710 [Rubripirellula obstinata]
MDGQVWVLKRSSFQRRPEQAASAQFRQLHVGMPDCRNCAEAACSGLPHCLSSQTSGAGQGGENESIDHDSKPSVDQDEVNEWMDKFGF